MSRILILAYGLFSYAMFLGVFLYAIGFLGNIYVPNSIDAEPSSSFWTALGINVGLLGLFAVQHSVMARPAFKKMWTKIVPEPAERATYVLFSNIAMIAMFALWQPMGGMVWDVAAQPWNAIIMATYFVGWGILFYATCLINHFDLFGLRQVWLHFQRKPYTRLEFREPGLYSHVRHPIYVGWLMIFWATPVMTMAHLLFCLMTTAYILIAIQLEERDLVDAIGDDYRSYRKRVPMLMPRLGKKPDTLGRKATLRP